MLVHTGQPLPQQMVKTVRGWDQRQATPGWLDAVPATVADLCAKWRIERDHVVPDTHVTLVALGHSDELGPVFVKSPALADEFLSEATALNLGAGENVVRVYDLHPERSAMVMERIVPGIQRRDVAMSDDDATRLAAETVAAFWLPAPDPSHLHPLRRWMRGLFDSSPRPDLIEADLIQQAQDLAAALGPAYAGARRDRVVLANWTIERQARASPPARRAISWSAVAARSAAATPTRARLVRRRRSVAARRTAMSRWIPLAHAWFST